MDNGHDTAVLIIFLRQSGLLPTYAAACLFVLLDCVSCAFFVATEEVFVYVNCETVAV